jgi:hypothetical protein
VPLSQLKSTFPVLRTVGRKKAAGFTLEQWRYAFTNTFTEEESRALYQRYHIPASVRVLWGSALATLEPGHQDTFVNYKNDGRAPLLFISGGEDHLMPPSVQRSQRQALQVQHRDRGQGVPRLRPPAARPEGLGTDRRRRPGLGRGARAVTDPQIRITAQLLIEGSEPTKISSLTPTEDDYPRLHEPRE